jgi:hypothetical protein
MMYLYIIPKLQRASPADKFIEEISSVSYSRDDRGCKDGCIACQLMGLCGGSRS